MKNSASYSIALFQVMKGFKGWDILVDFINVFFLKAPQVRTLFQNVGEFCFCIIVDAENFEIREIPNAIRI